MVDDVLAWYVVAAGARGELNLGAHTIGGGNEHRILHRHDVGEIEGAAKCTNAAKDRTGVGSFDACFQLIDGTRTFVDVDASCGVRREHGSVSAPANIASIARVGRGHSVDERICGGASLDERRCEADTGVLAAACGAAKEQLRIVGRRGDFERTQRGAWRRVVGCGDYHADSERVAGDDRCVGEPALA